MHTKRGWVAVALGLGALLLGGCVVEPLEGEVEDPVEPDSSELGTASDALSSLSCTLSTATGYRNGDPFTIYVVTVDGKKVEWKTANAYMKMATAASNAGVEIRVVSGFRTMAQQEYFYHCYTTCSCNNCNLAAPPGYSNHQSGHALDLNTASSGVLNWLNNHAQQYGFERTVASENWHWEWWGSDDGTGPCNGNDKDHDGVADSQDNCPSVKNHGQLDTDHDGKGDACDKDDDNDGVKDVDDNCPKKKNPGQLDTDGDGKGDKCDGDDDNDGVKDANDNCPKVANHGQLDTDHDGKGDKCDADDDGDGIPDADDNCPKVANSGQLDSDGDGKGDKCEDDDDEDGIVDADDNCPKSANDDQLDTDDDGKGDECDDDDDGDGALDSSDVCPHVPDAAQLDADGDGIGDACDFDADNDGIEDADDNCPEMANATQLDTDDDGLGDVCDDDADGDEVPNEVDACPNEPNLDDEACTSGGDETEAPPDLGPSDSIAASEEAPGCQVGFTTRAGSGMSLLLIGLLLQVTRRRSRR